MSRQIWTARKRSAPYHRHCVALPAAALSEKVRDEPVKVQLCGKELVLFRGEDGRVRCVDNICPHRCGLGALLNENAK